MATISYSFIPGDTAWHVSAQYGVREGVIKKVEIVQLFPMITPVVNYTIQFTQPTSGSAVDVQDNFYGDVDTALAAYRDLLV